MLDGQSERRCVPDKHITCPCCNPFPVVGYCDAVDNPCLYLCQLFLVVDSPHLDLLVVTAHDILAICRERHRPYFATGVYFNGLGTLLSNRQRKCNSVSQVRTGQRRGHRERDGGSQAVVRILFVSCMLFLVDIDQYTRRTASYLVPVRTRNRSSLQRTAKPPLTVALLFVIQYMHSIYVDTNLSPILVSRLRTRRPYHRFLFPSQCMEVHFSASAFQCSLHADAHYRHVVSLTRPSYASSAHVDAPGTSKTAIVARTKGGVLDLPQWWARRTEMNRVSRRGISENYQCVCVPVCIITGHVPAHPT